MADKTYEIELKTTADTEGITSVRDMLADTKSEAEDPIELNIQIDEVTSQLEQATAEVDALQEELASIEMGESDADFSEVIAQLEEAESKANDLSAELDELNSKSVEINVDDTGLDTTKEKANETASSMDNITTAVAGITATAGIEQMVTTADNINTSWNRLELTFKGTGVSMDTLKDKSSALSEATGRSGGTIRDYFNQMGIAGVTNTDLLSSSFEALSGKAYQTGNSIQSMETTLQRVAMSGQVSDRLLRNLGLSADELAKSMGVSAEEVKDAFENMTPEQRIEAITKAMGDGKEANEMYKDSYQGLKDKAEASMAGLMGAVGQAILPVVIPALQTATEFIKMLADGFRNLPAPVQTAIGAVLGVVAIGTTLIGTLGMVGKVVGSVKTGLETIGMLGKVTSVISSISGAFSSLWGVIIANPIILVVVAIIALIVALVWAYYNVDWFREMVDNAWASIQGFASWISGVFMGAITSLGDAFNNAGQTLQDAFTGAVTFVQETLQGLYDYIMTLGGLLPEGVNVTGNQIVDSIIAIMVFISTLPLQLSIIFMNMIASTLGFGDNFVQTMMQTALSSITGFLQWISQLPARAGAFLNSVVSRASSFAGSFISSIVNAGSSAVNGFLNSIGQMASGLANELNEMLSLVGEWASTLPQKFWDAGVNAVQNFLNALDRHSPGIMQRSMVAEITEMGERVPRESQTLLSNINKLGEGIVDEFGNPSLDIGTNLNESVFANNSSSSTGFNQVNNFYFEDITVDDDDRMQKIADYIQKQLDWNNKTAGRTI